MSEAALTLSSIRELRRQLASGALSAVDLVTGCLERIREHDRQGVKLSSLVAVATDAITQAKVADHLYKTGQAGPLTGIPVVLKDNIATVEFPTSAGSNLLANYYSASDAAVTTRLREAGALILGKANLHEFSYGLATESTLGGQTKNPYDTSRNAGGSSGGSAVAVASGFTVSALGTDTGGSIRFPAHHTNTFGLRPTHGLLPASGIIPLTYSMDTPGPITRHALDLEDMICALTGVAECHTQLAASPLRIGVLESYFGEADEEVGVTRVIHEALAKLEAAGATLVPLHDRNFGEQAADTALYEFEDSLGDYLETANPETPAANIQQILDYPATNAQVREQMQHALEYSGRYDGYRAAVQARSVLRRRLLETFASRGLDAIAYPVFRSTARLGNEEYWQGSNALLSSASGFPAVNVPAGFSGRLPVGVEFLAPPLYEPLLVGLAVLCEKLNPCLKPPHLA